MIALFRYQRENGEEPFTEWLQSVRDKVAQARIRIRLRQVEAGNMGDCEAVGDRTARACGRRISGLLRARGKTMVVLLCGGNKGSQAADIKRAKAYWAEWKRRQS